jgi:hypothetical protein
MADDPPATRIARFQSGHLGGWPVCKTQGICSLAAASSGVKQHRFDGHETATVLLVHKCFQYAPSF